MGAGERSPCRFLHSTRLDTVAVPGIALRSSCFDVLVVRRSVIVGHHLPASFYIASYCISLALSNTAEFDSGFRAISSTCGCSPREAELLRGGRAGEVRLLKNVTPLHLAALHGGNEVC